MDCECEICKSACRKRPGWFSPGEVAKAATLKGMTEKDFFDKYIGVDYFVENSVGNKRTPIFVLAPVTDRAKPGEEYPFNPHGTCVFFKDDKCDIHDAKPNECRFYDHAQEDDVCFENRNKIVEKWRENSEEIVRLLEREPQLVEPSLMESMDMVIDSIRSQMGGFLDG